MTITVTPIVPSLSYKTGNPLTAFVNAVVVGLSKDGQLSVISDSIPKAAATKITGLVLSADCTYRVLIPLILASADLPPGLSTAPLAPFKLSFCDGVRTTALKSLEELSSSETLVTVTEPLNISSEL